MTVPLRPEQADENRDALAKFVYNNLFDWLVQVAGFAALLCATLYDARDRFRFFPRAQYISGRYAGGTFVGYTKSGAAVPLATIAETPSLKWQLLNVTARTEVVSVRYNSPDGQPRGQKAPLHATTPGRKGRQRIHSRPARAMRTHSWPKAG